MSSSSVRVAIAAGDGIGPEIMGAVLAVFESAGVHKHVAFVPVDMGEAVFARGETRGMSAEAISTVEGCGILFKGPMGTPKGGGGKSINVTARKLWGAFANLRHFRTLPGVDTVYSRAGYRLNFYVVRENIEDTYGGIEHRLSNDVVECKRLISAPGCDQVCRFAFQTARKLGITRVHCGHKANIMKMTDGLFLERFYSAARDVEGVGGAGAGAAAIEAADVIVDALCMNMVLKPDQYQMIVLPNLQGDIVSDLAAGLVGGLGFAPSANIGECISIFEAVHGTAPDIAGKGIANPTSLLLSGLMMLRHLGLLRQAAAIENALLATLEDGVRTGDFGGKVEGAKAAVGTRAFAEAIVSRLGKKPGQGAVADATEDRPTFQPAPRPPKPRLMRTFVQPISHDVGIDIYIDTTQDVQQLASDLAQMCQGTPFRLTMISNRGTQVWPTGSVYTEVVDYFRVRFELRQDVPVGSISQSPSIQLAHRIADRYRVSDFQPLRMYDAKPGYSLAQGQ